MGRDFESDGASEYSETTSKGTRPFSLTDEEVVDCISGLSLLAYEVNANAKDKGFWDDEVNVAEKLCLIHSEVSEALEAHRKGDENNFVEELADILIRLLDLSRGLDLDIDLAVIAKMKRNAMRKYKHGKRY